MEVVEWKPHGGYHGTVSLNGREHQKGGDIMSRFSTLVLKAALLSIVVTVAGKGPAPEGGRGQGGQGQQAVTLPDGAGKDIVQTSCTTCHGLNQITGSAGYTREKWQELFANMIKLPDAQAAT